MPSGRPPPSPTASSTEEHLVSDPKDKLSFEQKETSNSTGVAEGKSEGKAVGRKADIEEARVEPHSLLPSPAVDEGTGVYSYVLFLFADICPLSSHFCLGR
jgi:hypothetical protein